MENGKMGEAMEELAGGIEMFFRTLVAKDVPVDVAANLTGEMLEAMILAAGKQHGGD